MLARGIEDVLPTALRHGMGILTYSPLGGGWLSGSWSTDARRPRRHASDSPPGSTCHSPRTSAALGRPPLPPLADDAGLTLIELAIAFVTNHPGVTSAIIGPRTLEQLETQLPAADVTLSPAILDRIDEIVSPA